MGRVEVVVDLVVEVDIAACADVGSIYAGSHLDAVAVLFVHLEMQRATNRLTLVDGQRLVLE